MIATSLDLPVAAARVSKARAALSHAYVERARIWQERHVDDAMRAHQDHALVSVRRDLAHASAPLARVLAAQLLGLANRMEAGEHAERAAALLALAESFEGAPDFSEAGK